MKAKLTETIIIKNTRKIVAKGREVEIEKKRTRLGIKRGKDDKMWDVL